MNLYFSYHVCKQKQMIIAQYGEADAPDKGTNRSAHWTGNRKLFCEK